MKVLVIDSDKTMREVLIRTLASAAVFSPLEADDCETGILAASSEKPDYIFADADSVSDDPQGLVTRLKAASPSAKIIVVSGMGVDESVVRSALDAGAANLSKPFRLEQLKVAAGIPDGPAATSVPAAKSETKKSFGNKKIIVPAVLILTFLAAVFAALRIFAPRPLPPAVFDIGDKNISYISFADGKLYVTDWLEQGIYVYRVPLKAADSALMPEGVFKKSELQPTAATVSGDALWVADSLQGMFFSYTLKPGSAEPLPRGNYRAPATSPAGVMAHGPDVVWSYDVHAKKLYKHSGADMRVTAAYDMPVESPCGMGIMGGVFFIGDSRTGRIVSLNPADMTVISVASPPEYSAGKEKMVGLTAGSRNVWTASESGKIYRHDPRRLSQELK